MISKRAQLKIQKLIDRYKAYLKFKAVGPQGVTREQLKDLIRSGMVKSGDPVMAPVTEAYLATHEQSVDAEAAPKSMQAGALDFLDRMMDRYAGKAADQLKTDILSSVEATLTPFVDRREGQQIYEALRDPKIYSKNLRGVLREKVDAWEMRYRTVIATELNRASNWGAMDAILHNNPEKGPEEITVFKQGNKPGQGACEYCARFWYLEDRITPRVYKLGELIANGSNIGRKKADWLPTVDATHPNETHILSELKPGFGFVSGGLEYIAKDHDEFRKQRKS